jgi:hypothetical protein
MHIPCLDLLSTITTPSQTQPLLPLYRLLSSPRSEELRLGPNLPSGYKKGCPGMVNGIPGRRPTLIEPERLKDFGEEELLNGDVRVWEARSSGRPEIQLTEPPKTRRMSEFKSRPRPSTEYLRFEDISAATFKIQSAIQKTPCTVRPGGNCFEGSTGRI